MEPVAVVGLGYVGLPLAVAFSEKFKCIGFDINEQRIQELKSGYDRTKEVDSLGKAEFSSNPADLSKAKTFVIAVPTPVTEAKIPDLEPLKKASALVGSRMQKGSLVVYESTVYPGATEEVCLPILEKSSGLKNLADFKVGYSPERINPGDKEHTLSKIVKIVSAQDEESLEKVAALYGSIVEAGIYRAKDIKTAEAAKVIENVQRDINISLMNELALIFDRLNLDTQSVLEAAGTKWNFLKFFPGLVGGHCIGVDPYYLTYRAAEAGYHPEVILAGRRLNDSMGRFVAEKTVKLLISSGFRVRGARVAVLGLSFKENCPDLRNTKVVDILDELRDYGIDPIVCDPVVDPEEAWEMGIKLSAAPPSGCDAVVLAVAHQEFKDLGPAWIRSLLFDNGVFVDVKSVFSHEDFKGFNYWRL